ncbi:MAG TPA: nucleotidyl transferase AbiEii/AbiGii toxin family protein [Candidatus Angelobacter sp.]|jgi:predicted nucleotidyltransferase component of viral defense system
MIDRREILEAASSFSLLPHIVEKDYVLGWMLAGINAHDELAESWVFKGGTCLKKCYFETYRFSEDLDFTLRNEEHLDQEFLQTVFREVVAWVMEESGLNIPADQLEFDIYDNSRGRPNCQGKIAYRGPVSPTSGGWPKIKLDLTADERLVLPSVRREVFHAYTDRPEGGIWANSYAYEEAFGEKLRALGERTRPRDLYDVVNLYRHTDSRPTAAVLLDVLRQKCTYKAIPVPTLQTLVPHRPALEAMWSDMLSHQLPVLPPLNDFWDALPEIFDWITSGAPIPERALIQRGLGEMPVRTRVLPMNIPLRSRSNLEIIRFAAANYLCVDLAYEGSVRRIEPYSLRQTAEGNYVLGAIRSDSGEYRSYRVDRMQGATVTSQVFTPRYAVELTSTGPLSVAPSAAMPRMPRMGRLARTGHQGPTYVYRCTVCGKTFNRKRMDGSLNHHKNRQGSPCYGRYGVYVRTKY